MSLDTHCRDLGQISGQICPISRLVERIICTNNSVVCRGFADMISTFPTSSESPWFEIDLECPLRRRLSVICPPECADTWTERSTLAALCPAHCASWGQHNKQAWAAGCRVQNNLFSSWKEISSPEWRWLLWGELTRQIGLVYRNAAWNKKWLVENKIAPVRQQHKSQQAGTFTSE